VSKLKIEYMNIDKLIPYENNPRNNDIAVEAVAESIKEFGFKNPVIIDEDNIIVAGHTRIKAGKLLGIEKVPTIKAEDMTPEQVKAFRIADNKTTELATWDLEKLEEELENLDLYTGFTEEEQEKLFGEPEKITSLSDRFVVPPFTVLDTRQGYWQARKREWIDIGILGEQGRGEEGDEASIGGVLFKSWTSHPAFYKQKIIVEKKLGREVSIAEFMDKYFEIPKDVYASGNSIFDPVMTEIAYRWFNIDGGKIIDPFAGGTTRGAVASCMGYEYTGVDLSERQVETNREQWEKIKHETEKRPEWIIGDSTNIDKLAPGEYDFIFSCPPYADLEVYSDDPRDISNMDYEEFAIVYREIIKKTVKMLKENRFACFVVSDIRDRKGLYRNFVGLTIQAFEEAGMKLYNEAILVKSLGSLPIRVTRQFQKGRKMGKTHENVLVFHKGDINEIEKVFGIHDLNRKLEKNHENILVFYKGDPEQIENEYGEVEIPDLEMEDELNKSI